MATSITDAKRIIREKLARHGLDCRLTARTIGFSDLARADCIFVEVHDWQPGPLAFDELEFLAASHGFRVE